MSHFEKRAPHGPHDTGAKSGRSWRTEGSTTPANGARSGGFGSRGARNAAEAEYEEVEDFDFSTALKKRTQQKTPAQSTASDDVASSENTDLNGKTPRAGRWRIEEAKGVSSSPKMTNMHKGAKVNGARNRQTATDDWRRSSRGTRPPTGDADGAAGQSAAEGVRSWRAGQPAAAAPTATETVASGEVPKPKPKPKPKAEAEAEAEAEGEAMDVDGGKREDELSAFYEVRLAFGTAFMRPVTVWEETVPQDASSEFPVLLDDKDASEGAAKAPRPPVTHTESEGSLPESDYLFIGTQSHYAFFRLYSLLQARLTVAKELAAAAKERKAASEAELVDNQPEGRDSDVPGAKEASSLPSFPTVVSATYALLNGGLDTTAFEETCRYLLGNGSYVLYTIDKLVSQVIRHLHAMATEDTSLKCVQLWRYCRAQQYTPLQYMRSAATLFANREDALFKLHVASRPAEDAEEASSSAEPPPKQALFLSRPPAVLAIEYLGTSDEIQNNWQRRLGWLDAYKNRATLGEDKTGTPAPPQKMGEAGSPSRTGAAVGALLGTEAPARPFPAGGNDAPEPAGSEVRLSAVESYKPPSKFAKRPVAPDLPRATGVESASDSQPSVDSSFATDALKAHSAAASYTPAASVLPRLGLGLGLGLPGGLDKKKRSREEKEVEEPVDKRPKPST